MVWRTHYTVKVYVGGVEPLLAEFTPPLTATMLLQVLERENSGDMNFRGIPSAVVRIWLSIADYAALLRSGGAMQAIDLETDIDKLRVAQNATIFGIPLHASSKIDLGNAVLVRSKDGKDLRSDWEPPRRERISRFAQILDGLDD